MLVRPCPASDLDCIASFEQWQGDFRIITDCRHFRRVNVQGVFPTLQQFVLRFDFFDLAFGIASDDVFHDDHVTGLRDGKVGLCGDDHPESLQLSRYIQLAVGGPVQQNFSQVRCPPFRRDGPQNIGQELGAKFGGRFQDRQTQPQSRCILSWFRLWLPRRL